MSQFRLRTLFLGILIVALILAGFGRSQRSRRIEYYEQARLAEFGRRLEGVPSRINQWVSTATAVPEDQKEFFHFANAVDHQFVHTVTNERLGVYILCGTPRNVTIHSPTF